MHLFGLRCNYRLGRRWFQRGRPGCWFGGRSKGRWLGRRWFQGGHRGRFVRRLPRWQGNGSRELLDLFTSAELNLGNGSPAKCGGMSKVSKEILEHSKIQSYNIDKGMLVLTIWEEIRILKQDTAANSPSKMMSPQGMQGVAALRSTVTPSLLILSRARKKCFKNVASLLAKFAVNPLKSGCRVRSRDGKARATSVSK